MFRAWACLSIKTYAQTEMLVSIRDVGHDPRGVLVASAMIYDREQPEAAEGTMKGRAVEIEPLCSEPFTFTHRYDPSVVTTRFRDWLEPVLKKGLGIWKRRL